MTSNHHKDEIFQEKKRPKSPIRFKISLNPEQKKAKTQILENTITLLAGKSGSGKTLLATQIALDRLYKKEAEKIVITRPTVSEEELGFLPGDLKEKMDPWLQPIYHNMFTLYNKEKIKKDIGEGKIEIVPVSFMRGRSFLNSTIIVDEAQNVTNSQMEMITTRIGLKSKMIICGDVRQIDLNRKNLSGFDFLCKKAEEVENMDFIQLKSNHRDPIVEDLLKIYESKN